MPFVDFLGQKKFLFGEELRFLDFYALECFEFINWLSDETFYAENVNVGHYIKRLKDLHQIDQYFKSERWLNLPFSAKAAKTNNTPECEARIAAMRAGKTASKVSKSN